MALDIYKYHIFKIWEEKCGMKLIAFPLMMR